MASSAWLPFEEKPPQSNGCASCLPVGLVALADLIPQLQKHQGARAATQQVVWLGAGIALVGAASAFSHLH
jgi:hypothetical protein